MRYAAECGVKPEYTSYGSLSNALGYANPDDMRREQRLIQDAA